MAVLGFTLDGTFNDKEITSCLGVDSLESLRRLREPTLSKESDSEPDSEPCWLKMACSESLSGAESDDIARFPVQNKIIPITLDSSARDGDRALLVDADQVRLWWARIGGEGSNELLSRKNKNFDNDDNDAATSRCAVCREEPQGVSQ